MTLQLQHIPVGAQHRPEPIAAVRTAAQLEAVRAIIAGGDFDYACNNPFTAAVEDYLGDFMFLWYDRSDRLHGTRIDEHGAALRDTVAEASTPS